MPSGPRIRANNVFGVVSDNPLTIGATSFNSTSLFLLPAVSSAHAIVVLDPKRVNGEPEIVIVTAHTALATSATITRGAYGTTARQHAVNTAWAHVAVTDDIRPIVTSGTRPTDPFEGQQIYETDTHRPAHRDNTQWLAGGPVSVVTSGTRPANPYEGQSIYETDTDRVQNYSGAAWLQDGLYFDPPFVRVLRAANQSIATASATNISWDTEINDTDSMFTLGAPTVITLTTAGIYEIKIGVTYANNGTGERVTDVLFGGVLLAQDVRPASAANGPIITMSFTRKFTAGQTFVVRAFQNSGGNLNIGEGGSGHERTFCTATWIGRGN